MAMASAIPRRVTRFSVAGREVVVSGVMTLTH
jgi:hypothetical protein